ncbi:hypothetical protein C3B59_18250 [Cryobacterium zongtaii]|uniref:Tyrosine specific protein phosphatases domain-containing protein n=1 Tax=Cryobacterium zongtaii TaxID=1259217 RepID=A0A2S3Z5E8_9MICO|nr:dual specificity protein phosphatase [Cryobacterium zongtaii]POH59155.1 hypothetical protein C3B59_18250 [Cryobacterium zongtaii]
MKRKLKLANVCQLTDQLWIGGELSPVDPDLAQRQLDELCASGIDSIVDTRIERDDVDWVTEAKAEIDYLHIGVEDAGFLMPDDWFDEGVTYALDQIGDGHVVLAHCQAGINRGPTMGFAILLAQGWDPIDALELIRTRRPIARIAYAEQAVDWWCRKTDVPEQIADEKVLRVEKWRDQHGVPL